MRINTDMPEDIRELSPIALAFVGDGVLDLLVRARLAAQNRLPVGALHKEATEVVSAKGQSQMLEYLEPMLTTEEKNWVRRGRNAKKASVSKNATPGEYKASTGLEALLGWLYLQNETQRISELFEHIWQRHVQLRQQNEVGNA